MSVIFEDGGWRARCGCGYRTIAYLTGEEAKRRSDAHECVPGYVARPYPQYQDHEVTA